MKFKYEELEIWQIAVELIKTVNQILKKFPKEETFVLVSQGKRAVVSIALNIAEGSGRHTDKDFGSFINRSITSLQETDAVLKIGIASGYITKQDYSLAEPMIKKEYYKLVAFHKTLRKDPSRGSRFCEPRYNRGDTASTAKTKSDTAIDKRRSL